MIETVVAALDVGQRRIGIAVTDASGIAVHPLGVIERRSADRDIDQIGIAIADRRVARIVVGLPLNMDGSEGRQARSARAFAARLRGALGIPVELFDERLSSVEAEERLANHRRRRGRRKAAVDAVAAAIILERWLTEGGGRSEG